MLSLFRYHNKAEKDLARYINNVFGFYPRNISLFQLAFTHKSLNTKKFSSITINNERLEYLGDTVLSTIVGEYLFKKFPTKQEGFLTEMRSKIVSRASLNKLSMKLGFDKMVMYTKSNDKHTGFRSIGGNAFEAFTGALFLDRGYNFTRNIIVDHVILIHLDLDEIQNNEVNYKSRLLEWSQKEKHNVEFKTIGVKGDGSDKLYIIQAIVDDKEYGKASDFSIKGAEQLAAEKTWHMMEDELQYFEKQ